MTESAATSLHENKIGRTFLVVDDDPMVRKIVTRGLSALEPAEVIERENGIAAQEVLQSRSIDVVITDVVMPHMDGLELMKWAQEHAPGPLWIVLSGVETFDAAVEALQLGAFDYLAKPPEIPRVRVAVRNALDQIELVSERQRLYGELEESNQQLAEKVGQLQTVCRVLEDQAATIQADLDRAEIIQRALLPQQPPVTPGWSMETLYRPGSSVGGDFYDVRVLDETHLGIVIADAAGHGVAAAMLSVLFKLRLRKTDRAGKILSPVEVLEQLNERLYDMLSAPGAFITAAYVLVDLQSGTARAASAGHPPCLVCNTRNGGQFLERTGPALGLEKDASYTEHSFVVAPGDRILLYTDGVLDGGPDSPDTESLKVAVTEASDRTKVLETQFENAIRGLDEDRDDVTMLLLERCEGASHFDDGKLQNANRSESAQPAPLLTEPGAAPPDHPHVAEGAMDGRGYISIVGSITWLCGHGLLGAASKLMKSNDELTLDLSQCEHMDSTCLGTLHEIVVSNPGRVEIQGVSEHVRKLFEELSMSAVLAQITTQHRALPDALSVIETAALSPQQQGARILSAHETLVALSDDNEEQFRAVVDSLRADLPE